MTTYDDPRPLGMLVRPGRTGEVVAGHIATHRLPCIDDEPTLYVYGDGCKVDRLRDGGWYFTPSELPFAKEPA